MPSVSDFIIERMVNSGLHHVFGVPGDHVLGFFNKLSNADIEVIQTIQECDAVFAADAYARIKGLGCACVSQHSALKVANAIACAYAERSPVLLISGAERSSYHQEVFRHFTCCSVSLDNPMLAGYAIDLMLEKMSYYKQPAFIELLQTVSDKPVVYDVYKQGTPSSPVSDLEILGEAVEEVVDWLNSAKYPVVLAGVQIARCGLGVELLKFAERHNIPIVSTILSKSVVDESHPLFLGVYAGAGSGLKVQQAIKDSDCLLMLGTSNGGGFNFIPKKKQSIFCSSDELRVKNHLYANSFGFEDFANALFKSKLCRVGLPSVIIEYKPKEFKPKAGVKITMARLFEKINSVIGDNFVVVDVGDALLGSSELIVHHSHFVATAFYPSMGFAIPAALGVQVATKIRPIVIMGDAAFQMSCGELGTIVGRRLNPIIFVLNNGGYATDFSFVNIQEWDFEKIVEVIGGGKSALVEEEQELQTAVTVAINHHDSPFVINVKIDPDDVSQVLCRIRKEKRVKYESI